MPDCCIDKCLIEGQKKALIRLSGPLLTYEKHRCKSNAIRHIVLYSQIKLTLKKDKN